MKWKIIKPCPGRPEEVPALADVAAENTGFMKHDVRKKTDRKYVVRVTEETLDSVNILVNNACLSSSNDGKCFTFEGRQYNAMHNAPGYTGLMIFTDGGVAVQEYQFPELWMYYEHQKDFF